MKKAFTTIGIICIVIVAAIAGWYIYKFFWGIVFFLVFACGGIAGYGIGRIVPKKTKEQKEKEAAEKKAKEEAKK